MRIALIGGTHFIGPVIVRGALARGHDVSVLHRGDHPNPIPEARDCLVHRTDPAALEAAIDAVDPDVVVDTRAMTAEDARISVHACMGRPVVVLSSSDVYAQFGRLLGHPAPDPEPEIAETSPLTVPFPYRDAKGHDDVHDYDKKQVEAVFTEALEDGTLPGACFLRLPPVYGPGDPHGRFAIIVDTLDRGEAIPCVSGASWRWTHGHVRDTAHAVLLAAEAPIEGAEVYNVGEQATPTLGERARAIADHMGVDLELREVDPDELPDDFEHFGEMENDLLISSRKIREELGFAEVTTEVERLEDIVIDSRSRRIREHR